MSPLTLLLIILVVLIVAGAPGWGMHDYGWYPSSGVGLLLLLLIVLIILGRI